MERPGEAFGEGFGHFYAATLFNDATQVAPPGVDACTFVYYKSVMDEAGNVPPAPFPVNCNAADKWRNRHCASTTTGVVDPDQSTERDWLQFLWSWHATSLNNDIGEMFDTMLAACRCSKNVVGDVNCAVTCSSNPLAWDWPANDDAVVSLREGVISRASGGLSSTQVNPQNFQAYRDFEGLSDDRGVSRKTAP